MFLTLTRVLLWLLVFYVLYKVLVEWIPKPWFTTLGGLLLLSVAAIGFYNPNLVIPFEAWKIVSLPLQPLGLGLLLLLLGFNQVKGGWGWGQPQSWFLWGGFLVLLLSSLPIVSFNLAQIAEEQVVTTRQDWRDYTPTVNQAPAAIVLLGEDTTKPHIPYRTQIELTDTGDRIIYAAQLYKRQIQLTGEAPLVIVSAPIRDEFRDSRVQVSEEAFDVADILQRLGVSNRHILLETEGVDLRTSAVATADMLEDLGIENEAVYVVTSSLNNRRAALTFVDAGVRAISAPTDFYTVSDQSFPTPELRLEDFLPSTEALSLTKNVVEEYLGSIYYFLRGWLSPIELD